MKVGSGYSTVISIRFCVAIAALLLKVDAVFGQSLPGTGYADRIKWTCRHVEAADEMILSVRMQPLVDGIPVYGYQTRSQSKDRVNSQDRSEASKVLSHLRKDCNPMDSAAFLKRLPDSWVSEGAPQLFWYLKNGEYSLSYITTGTLNGDLRRMQWIADACTGETIHLHYTSCNADTAGIANTMYSGTETIPVRKIHASSYELKSNSRGSGIETYNLNHQLGYSNVTAYVDSDNIWNGGEPNPVQHAADAHYNATMFYDYLNSKFARNSLDNNGMKLISYLNYGNSYLNAFWNGNAVVYGGGNSLAGPMTTLDITGHEFGHGLVQEMTGLLHSGEQGILQESLADMFGTALERTSGLSPDWLIGEDNGNPIRSMSNPETFNHPDTYMGNHWYYGTADNGGVHINCGFLNKWFFLMSEGGTGVNDNGYAYSVTGLGIDPVMDIIYSVMQMHLVPQSGFHDFMQFTILESANKFGNCSQELQSVVEAWKAVGLYQEPVTIVETVTPAPYCEGSPVAIRATGAVYSTYIWYKDGMVMPAAPNSPEIEVTQSGQYAVTENRCGTVIQTQAINVVFSQLPLVQVTDVETCAGIPAVISGFPSGGTFSVQNPYSGPSTSFTYTLTSLSGCSQTATGHILVNEPPLISISSPVQQFFADDPSVGLAASPSGGSWSGTGLNGNNFDPVLSGSGYFDLYYSVVNNEGCSAVDTISVHVSNLCRPFHDSLRIAGADAPADLHSLYKLSIENAPAGSTVQWVIPDNFLSAGPITGHVLEVNAVQGAGEITATVTNICGEKATLRIHLKAPEAESILTVYPVPSKGDFILSLNQMPVTGISFKVFDAKGKEVRSGVFKPGETPKISVGKLSPGVYSIIVYGPETLARKIVVTGND